MIAAVAVIALAITAAWSAQRPQEALDRVDDALAALADRRPDEARKLALEAGDLNPLSLEPLFALAEIEGASGRPDAARAAYEKAVKLQPASADAWVRLANFELVGGQPQQALTQRAPGALPRSALKRREGDLPRGLPPVAATAAEAALAAPALSARGPAARGARRAVRRRPRSRPARSRRPRAPRAACGA